MRCWTLTAPLLVWIAGTAGCSDPSPAVSADLGPDGGVAPDAGCVGTRCDAASPADHDAPALDAPALDAPAPDAAPPLPPDKILFERVLAGEVPAAEGLQQIAVAGGWPVEVAPGSFLFARLDDGGGPYRLAGAHEGWQGQAMTHEAGLYWLVAQVPQPDGAKYKFIDGQGAFAADPLGRRYGYDDFGRYSLVRAVGAHLELYPALSSASVSPRAVRIWVPPDPPTHHLYVHDGQNLFDPAAPFGGWQLASATGPATLVVGIDSNDDRMTDYTPSQDNISGSWVGGGADAYAAFVLQVVRPLVQQRFGTPQRVGVMGSSLGGLLALHQALRDPGAYDFAASLSGTVGWGSINASNPTLFDSFAAAGKIAVALYLDSGGGPGAGCVDSDGDGLKDDTPSAPDNYCENVELKEALVSLGYTFEKDLWYWYEPDAAHNEAAWATRVWRPLSVFESL